MLRKPRKLGEDCEVIRRNGRRCRRQGILLTNNGITGVLEIICKKHANGRHIYRDYKGNILQERERLTH